MTNGLLRDNLSSEFQVMLAGLQAHLETAPTPNWRAIIKPELNWAHVLELCQYHEVTPLVYESLSQQADVPARILQTFKRQVVKDKHLSMRLTQALRSLLFLFNREDLAVLPYKGVALSEQLFGDITKRPTKDLDVVVQKQDYHRVKDLLLEAGFHGPYTATGELAVAQVERILLAGNRHLKFFNHKGLSLELHFELFPPDKHSLFALADIWDNLEDSSFYEQPIKTLNSEQLLLVLATHATNHLWKRLKWLFDSAALLDSALSPETLVSLSEQEQVKTILLVNAALCHALLALPAPSFLQSAANRSLLDQVAHGAIGQFAIWPHKAPTGFSRFQLRFGLYDSHDFYTLKRIVGGLIMRRAPATLHLPTSIYLQILSE